MSLLVSRQTNVVQIRLVTCRHSISRFAFQLTRRLRFPRAWPRSNIHSSRWRVGGSLL